MVQLMAKKNRRKGEFVYFIQRADSGRIKIGTTMNMTSRLAQVATATDAPVEIIGVMRGGHYIESVLHCRFARHECHGEWFSPHADIVDFINQNTMGSIAEIVKYESTFRHVASFVNSTSHNEENARTASTSYEEYICWCSDMGIATVVDGHVVLDEWVMRVMLGSDDVSIPEIYAVPLRRFVI